MAERFSFTRPATERIARVVRAVENARPGGEPLRARRILIDGKPKVFRVATFTGSWAINSTQTVTFTSNPTATVVATNLFFPVSGTAASSRACAVAKDGTAWFLVDIPFRESTAVFGGSTQTAVSTTLTTSAMTYVTGISATLNTSNCQIVVSQATATAASVSSFGTTTIVMIASTYTATYLKAWD
jgi:hypothetical protein